MRLAREDEVDQLTSEGLQLVVDALAEAGVHVSAWTAIRWARRGIRGTHLEALKVGGRWQTSVPAVKRFLARQGLPERSRGDRSRRVQTTKASERYLESLGLGRTQLSEAQETQ